MYVVGGLDDQTGLLVWGEISRSLFTISNPAVSSFPIYQEVFKGLINPLSTNQPVTWVFVSAFLSVFGAQSYNLLILFTVLLNFLASLNLFKRFKFPLFYSLVFTFSSFMWVHLGKHIEVSQMWVLPLFVNSLLNERVGSFSLKSSFKLGLLLSLAALIFNYFGLFLMLLHFFYSAYSLYIRGVRDNKINLDIVKSFIASSITALLVTLIFLFPYIRANYFPSTKDLQENNSFRLNRPIEDFFSFSSRPWYFFVPAPSNPVLGDISEKALRKIKSTGYFLTDDYFSGESPVSFFGYAFIASFLTVLSFSFIKSRDLRSSNSLDAASQFTFIAFALFLFTLPPFITISGFKIFTPGFLVYKYFPMFRVTSRLSILILLCLLLAFGYGLEFLYSKGTRLHDRLRLLLSILLISTLVETFVPVKLYKTPAPAKAYEYLNSQTPFGTKFAVYPYSSTKHAFLFTNVHGRYLLNPPGFSSDNFDSRKITDSLSRDSGINQLRGLNADYLLVFKTSESGQISSFTRNSTLRLEKEFNDAYLFKVKGYPL